VGYRIDVWTDLFDALAGASAALTGLLFVSVSINLSSIVGDRALVHRSLETLSLLVGLLVLSILLLVPEPDTGTVGAEIAVLGLLLGLPLVLAGSTLAAGSGGGLYWLVPAVISGLVGSSVNAWVLLVEIHR
jgi:modulator of FtsH protease